MEEKIRGEEREGKRGEKNLEDPGLKKADFSSSFTSFFH